MDGPHIYEFGNFRLDPSRRRLLRSGEPVALTPKVFDTLLYLVEHRGSILGKDELLAALWPDVVVEENNLGQNISKLRIVLGETRGENRYIMTVPGHGYRFVAEVHAVSPPLPQPTPEEAPPAGSRDQVRRVAVIGVLVAGLALSGFYVWRGQTGAGFAPPRTVAVLPFKPLLPENRDQALELGMADSLIAKLSNIRELSVRPLGAVRTYTRPDQNPFTAGRELGVEAVLDGHIQRSGDRIR
ncbi:MAG: winged helix-turn-helix domain-containing protein [Vicinamibacterales bacterium]